MQRILVFGLAGLSIWILAGCSRHRPAGAFLKKFSGSSAINCGTFPVRNPPDEVVNAAMDCALKANRERKAFFFLGEDQGYDSAVAFGFAGKKDGVIVRFIYDSAPCGGPQCGPYFIVEPCAAPRIDRERDRVQMMC